ncbi:MAG: gamma-glutamyltransferase family protein [Betaproteobacteria bacterium]|nr:gamma-glutamyltransferase family protein [Betaproteobacteria bacterium]
MTHLFANTPIAAQPVWRHHSLSVLLAAVLMASAAHCLAKDKAALPTQPEAASGFKAKPGWNLKNRGVAAANPMAAEAGYQILKAGGSAVDAAIAVQMVLTLVEPQSSGIGGGAFLLHNDGKKTQVFDGRETAPHLAHDELFMFNNGQLMSAEEAAVGGRAVGVPGVLRMLEAAHRQHGKLAWSKLFQPAIELAERGFKISPRLHAMLMADRPLRQDLQAAPYFYKPNGQPHPVGHVLKNPGLAQVLKVLAKEGADGFYQGALAQQVVNKVSQHPNNPGLLTMYDMARYRSTVREPLCFSHLVPDGKNVEVCGAPPPSSGLIAMGQVMGILSGSSAALAMPSPWSERQTVVPNAAWLHNYNEAARLAFADRAVYVADPDFVKAPGGQWSSLLAPAYLQQRASLIQDVRMADAPAGQPAPAKTSYAPMPEQPEHGTSHISIVDGLGNSVSMTTSIETSFGSRVMVSLGASGGFLLNSQLTDFSFTPFDANGQAIANRVQANKRPRSSMNPVLVFEQTANGEAGPVLASMGSPGGNMIIHFTAQSLWAMLHWKQNAQQAFNMPHSGLVSPNGILLLEKNTFSTDTLSALTSKNHVLLEVDMPSGLQGIQRQGAQWLGAADPRREGHVSGD